MHDLGQLAAHLVLMPFLLQRMKYFKDSVGAVGAARPGVFSRVAANLCHSWPAGKMRGRGLGLDGTRPGRRRGRSPSSEHDGERLGGRPVAGHFYPRPLHKSARNKEGVKKEGGKDASNKNT